MSEETKKEEVVSTPEVEVKAEEKVEAKAEVKVTEESKVEVPAKFKDIVSKIEEMSVIDLHELVKVLEEKFGVSAQAVAVAGSAVQGGADAGEEKSSFTVELTEAGEQKIAVMKVVKEVLALGLKEAKELVDGAPAVLKDAMKKEDAEDLKKKIEEAGGKVTLK